MSVFNILSLCILCLISLSQAQDPAYQISFNRPRPVRPTFSRPTRRPLRPVRTTTTAQPPDSVEPEFRPEDSATSTIGCGVQAPGLFPNGLATRVINGKEAKAHSWPWVIALLGGSGRVQCGGSLLRVKDDVDSTDMVLTAAHCVARLSATTSPQMLDASSLTIAAGRHRFNQATQYSQESRGQTAMIHPNYGKSGMANDVALIKLATPIKFTNGVRPICVPPQGAEIPTNLPCVAAGWGRNNSANFQTAEALQQVVAPPHSAEICNRGWPGMYQEDAMICAGELNGESGVCNGDSGSTLMCFDGNRWTQYGVVSFGVGGKCLEENKPDVYARVSSYADWIQKGIEQMSTL